MRGWTSQDVPGAAMLEWSKGSQMLGYFFDDPSMRAAESDALTLPTKVESPPLTQAQESRCEC